jgi:serine/threonine protein phosphatase PrpC
MDIQYTHQATSGEAPGPQPTGTEGRASTHDLQVGLASDAGRIRDRNEDASLAWQFTLAQHGQAPLSAGLFVIADGMGGHLLGEQASALAVRAASNHVISQLCLPLLSADEGMANQAPINEVLETGMRIAHQTLSRRLPEAGTTMTMALVLADSIYIAHIGDSRAYLGQRGHIRMLTKDHSMAARLLEMGQASPEEAASQRNILFKALGQGGEVEPDILYRDLDQGQFLLLCCDGLWGMLSDEEILTIVQAAPTPDLACQGLVACANEKGGQDNISVIVVARGWPPPASDTQVQIPE